MLRSVGGRGAVPRSSKGDFEPGLASDGSGPKFAELFDIYLMSFSGDARVIVAELGRAFRIEEATARLLVAQVPVVIKRRVEPDLAAQYFDVLAQMGAQVVLMPSPQSSAPPAAGAAVASTPDSEPAPDVSFEERPPRGAHDSEPAPEVSFEPLSSATRAGVSAQAPEAAHVPQEFDFSMPSQSPDAAPETADVAALHSGVASDAFGMGVPPASTTPMRELPRLGTATVVDTASPFETVPPPAPAPGTPSPEWSMSPPDWGIFEKRDPTATLVEDSALAEGGRGKAPSFPPLPPPALAPAPGPEAEESWLNPLPKPKTTARDPGSGLFMAESADDFIGTGPRTTQTVPLPVIKPLRERPVSEPPPEPEMALPPPVRLPAPPRLPGVASPMPRPPPRAGNPLIAPSIPPPVPASAAMPTMSRRPPSLFETPREDPSVLRLEFDKVPPLPSVSIAPVPPNQIDVDPGDLASLPRIELEGVRDTAAQAAGAKAPVANAAKQPAEPELVSLPPLEAPRAPTPAPARASAASAPKTPTLGAGVAPVGAKSGGGPPPPPGIAKPGVPATTPGAALSSASRERLGKLRMPTIPDGVRRAVYGLALVGCAVAIFAFGVRADSSVLYGNASLPAVLLHAFALYAVGAGVLGMFRS